MIKLIIYILFFLNTHNSYLNEFMDDLSFNIVASQKDTSEKYHYNYKNNTDDNIDELSVSYFFASGIFSGSILGLVVFDIIMSIYYMQKKRNSYMNSGHKRRQQIKKQRNK